MAEATPPKSYSSDPVLYLYTSLTSGSSHIVTATSRMETILKANRIPFRALDIATDEKARMLWGRRAGKDESGRARKIPGLVQMGLVVGDLVEVEEWNEYGELKQHIKIVPIPGTPSGSAAPTPTTTPSKAPVAKENIKPTPTAESKLSQPVEQVTAQMSSFSLAMKQVGQEAAQKAKDGKKKAPETLEGVGQADPAEASKKSAATPPPLAVLNPPHNAPSNTVLQSPTSSAWRSAPSKSFHTPKSSLSKLESMQSPTSTAWKPSDTDGPVLTHRGSSISMASDEEIKQVEESEMIMEAPEEDEDAVED